MLKRLGLLTLVAIASATACAGSEAVSSPATDPSEPVASTSATVEAFCAEFASLQVEQPESYVGSADHAADIDGLLAVAPEMVASDVATFSDYVSSGAIDATGDPESSLTANWPETVRTAIANTQEFASQNC